MCLVLCCAYTIIYTFTGLSSWQSCNRL